MKVIALGLILFAFTSLQGIAEDKDRSADEAAIRKNLEAYLSAYQKKDAATLAGLWSESGKFLSPLTGERVSGQKEIEAAYKAMFEEDGDVALEAKIQDLRFISDDVAVEEGEATVARPGDLPMVTSYQAIHIKQGEGWYLDSVRETVVDWIESEEEPGSEEEGVPELKELEWMIGDWIDQGDDGAIELSCSWGMGKNFLRRDFAVVIEDRVTMDGIEVIGWDAREKKYRSWVFDSTGGFGSAVWEKGTIKGEWLKKLTGTTRDGKKVYSVHVSRPIDENSYAWRAHGRVMDGIMLPNIDEVIVTRLNGEE